MRTLGLLGGMSWESTAIYYRHLNEIARDRRGGLHSAPLLLWSVDFAEIAQRQHDGDWAGAGAILADAARRLEQAGAEALVLCTNTMHRLADELQAARIGLQFRSLQFFKASTPSSGDLPSYFGPHHVDAQWHQSLCRPAAKTSPHHRVH